MGKYRERTYRNLVHGGRLVFFRVAVKETDLAIYAVKKLEETARESVLRHRGYLEAYIERRPSFAVTLNPWTVDEPAAPIVRDMVRAGRAAGVGPMAAVAGAVAEHVGKDLLAHSSEVIVENGGDVFIKTDRPSVVGIFAGKSPLSLRIGVTIDCEGSPMAVCASSGTVGHSKSMGRADAVCVLSRSCALADAAATAIGNLVSVAADIPEGVEFGKRIEGVLGIVIVVSDKIGAWGRVELTSLGEKC